MNTGFLQDAPRLLEEGTGWAGLSGDALGFVLAELGKNGRWLVVTDEPDEAQRILRGLRFFLRDPDRAVLFPADDARPYDGFSPDPEVVRERIRTLARVEDGEPIIVVAPARALLLRVASAEIRKKGTRTLTAGEVVGEREQLLQWLTDAGYLATGRVEQPGTFAVRGDVVDVWANGDSAPVRIDLFDDEIEALRRVDPATNRASGSVKTLHILPAREERIDSDALDRLHTELNRHVQAQDRGVVLRRRVTEELRAGVRFSALEDWLPALVPTVAPLDVFAELRPVVVSPNDVLAALRDFHDSARRRWSNLDDDERPLVPPDDRFVPAALAQDALDRAHKVWDLAAEGRSADLGARPVDGFAVRGTELGPVVSRIQKLARDTRVALVCDSVVRADRLEELLEPHGLRVRHVDGPWDLQRGQVALLVGDLPRGFVAAESGWAFIPASALFGGARDRRKAERVHALFDASVRTMSQLKAEDLVVHRIHGVGRFQGLRRISVVDTDQRRFVMGAGETPDQGAIEQDFVRIEYRGGDLLLPATRLADLSRYTPARSGANIRLDKLGGATWQARKGKVRDSLLKMAQNLLDLYARRELATREALDPPGPMYRAFEARFPFDETPDQAAAIEAVNADLSIDHPMDRLICGDVGFGKTEVAMRAAMRMVEAGHQVAVLCPTTVLAYQHALTMQDRFAGFPVNIGMLSRFNTTAQDHEVLAGLRSGSLDIVVGTTAILGPRVRFANLGLVVIDEEHRFGVKQKDRLKRMRTKVDILSMSATPIPRTLQMAMGGIREMSVMATPPQERLSVRTTVARMTESRVRDAIRQELERGGQCFFLHNRVETIDKMAEQLAEWVPDARFAIAHGQMDDRELENVLVDFVQKRTDVLVCTAIVESGIDMPNVNTMLVHRADMFGLAQLYQLRGRVGRSNVRARCLLLVPEVMTSEARKRLQVVVDNTQLGAGFAVAAADLELRGGGNLLGKAQSGNIDKVGYEVWVELLGNAVHEARGDYERERIDPEVEVPVPAFIPDDLVKDMNERLGWYRRFSSAPTPAEVEGLVDEFEDLEGEVPPELQNLAGLLIARLECRELGIVRCRWLKVRAALELHPSSPLDEARLARVMQNHPKRFEIAVKHGVTTLSARFTPREAERPFRFLRWAFAQLRQAANPAR